MSKAKKAGVILALVVTFLLTGCWIFYNSLKGTVECTVPALSNSVLILNQRVMQEHAVAELVEESCGFYEDNTFSALDELLQSKGNVGETLDLLSEGMTDYALYFIDSTGKVFRDKRAGALSLSPQQLRTLKAEGRLDTEEEGKEVCYLCAIDGGNTAISRYLPLFNGVIREELAGMQMSNGYFLADGVSGEILDSSDERLTGSILPDDFFASFAGLEDDAHSKTAFDRQGFVRLGDTFCYAAVVTLGQYIAGAFYPVADVLLSSLKLVIMLILGIAVCFVLIAVCLFRQRARSRHSDGEFACLPGRKARWFDRFAFRQSYTFVLLALIVMSVCAIYVSSMTDFTYQYMMSSENLELLTENIQVNQARSEVFQSSSASVARLGSNVLAERIKDDPQGTSHEFLRNYARNEDIDEILLYDKNGTLEASSEGLWGYDLTTDENDAMYVVRRLLNSDDREVFAAFNDGSDRFLFARRRTDAPGALCLILRSEALSEVYRIFSREESIRSTDFGSAATFFIKSSDADSLYMIEPFSDQIETFSMPMPEEFRIDKFSGIVNILGKDYYVTTRQNQDLTVISALECNQTDAEHFISCLPVIAAFFVALLIVVYACCLEAKGEAVKTERFVISDLNPWLRTTRSETFSAMVSCLTIVAVISCLYIIFLSDKNGNSMWKFMTSGEWRKSVNIFAVTLSVIIVSIIQLITDALHYIVWLIGQNNGSRGTTVGNVLASILRLASAFLSVGIVLYEIGIDGTALLTSAGIVSLVIGIAARGMFEDLIAGLFLIMDNKIHVGDRIDVGGFEGKVREIGVRLSVLENDDRRLVINNKDIKRFCQISDAESGKTSDDR